MELISKAGNNYKPLNIFSKSSILDLTKSYIHLSKKPTKKKNNFAYKTDIH